MEIEMSERRQMVVIAGPNGAGKSTISFHFADSSALVYDPDKESQLIRDKFPELPNESIYYLINNNFHDKMSIAINGKRDFVLETNFRDYQIMDTVTLFRDKGYETNLMYFLLRSEQESQDRVTERVNDGGHFVDQNSIHLNYVDGLENMFFFSPRFDRILLFNASARIGELEPMLNISKGRLKFVSENIPAWANTTVQKLRFRLLENERSVHPPDTGSNLNR